MFKPNQNSYKILVGICSVIVTAAIGYLLVGAGNLNPLETPADTVYTLDDIYYELDKDVATSSWGLNPSASPTSTMYTLEEIYNKTPKFRSAPGNASTSDVSINKTFYNDSAIRLTGTLSAGGVEKLVDTGQAICYSNTVNINCGGIDFPNQDADWNAASSTHTCEPSYTTNTNTVTDNCTGLEWQKYGHGSSDGFTVPGEVGDCYNGEGVAYSASYCTYYWQGALKYCYALDMDGKTDWRLPNYKELVSILKLSGSAPFIEGSTGATGIFPYTESGSYWCATTYTGGSITVAYLVHFGTANVTTYDKDGYPFYVRCVSQ